MQYILNENEYQAFLDLKEENAKLSHSHELLNKKLAEQAHELLVKDAELADLSGKLREAKRDCEGTSSVLAETQKISAARLATMNNLIKEVRRLKSEYVCIIQNPRTGTVRVVPADKADTYRQFGWTVSEKHFVDRSA